MPLPPAPTQRASRLTHTAFEAQTAEEETAPVMVQVETKKTAVPVLPAVAMEPKRVARGRKAPTAATTPPAEPAPTTAAKPSFAPASRPKRRTGPSKLFVLDTNVLMHDPMSLFRFEEHLSLIHI
jgi:PhoH-like ATPase